MNTTQRIGTSPGQTKPSTLFAVPAKTPQRPMAQQRGIATILIILLTGLSLLAVILGLNSYMRANQEHGVTLQAQTQAQVKTWTGAEIVRLYLGQLLKNEDAGQSPKLSDFVTSSLQSAPGDHQGKANVHFNPPIDLKLSGIEGLSAHLVGINQDSANSDNNEYIIDVSSLAADHSRAQATSTLRLVYRVAKQGGAKVDAVMDWRRDLNLSGGISVTGKPGVPYTLMVDGNVYTQGNTITGVDTIQSTGSIYITSGSSFKNLHANGDIRITGSVHVQDEMAARGDICLEGGASATGTVRANGSVIAPGGRLGNVYSAVKSDNTQYDQLCANPPSSLGIAKLDFYDHERNGIPFGVDLGNGVSAESIQTKGSIRAASVYVQKPIAAQGDLVVTNWPHQIYGSIGGAIRVSPYHQQLAELLAQHVSINKGLTVATSPVSVLTSKSDLFNAYTVEGNANYAFKVDSNGYKVVDVRNISGMADGTYFIGDYDNNAEIGWSHGYKDYLCQRLASNSTASSPRCQAPVDTVAGTICKSYSDYNNCFSYANGKWTIQGTTLAPGILWFEGDLEVSNGNYYGSLIATGNITTSGGSQVYAANYAGYDGWQGTGNQRKQYAPTGVCSNTNFPGKMPTNLCKNGQLETNYANGLGNYALMAGSCTQGNCSTYHGGNIDLGASNAIHGNVLAGNVFNSGGDTTVYGYITSLGLGNTSHNSQGGSTKVNISDLPPHFKPMSGAMGSTDSERFIQVRWSRYL